MEQVLLITRPEPGATRFAASVRAAGWVPLVAPMMRIERSGTAPDLDGIGALVFTSANGVAAFAAASPRRDLKVHAVGAATARAARAAGFADVAVAGGDADALVAALARQGAGPALLHVRGRHVAGDLAARLQDGGRSVREAVMYDQTALPLDPGAEAALRDGVARAVALFSPRLAALFAGAAAALALPGPVDALCLSANVAAALGAGPFRVTVAARPDEAGMLAALGCIGGGGA
jgi:uroporphyrinogen-III synthase